MFGSEAVRKHVYNVVRALPSMAGITIAEKQAVGPTATYPLLLHYPEQAPYNQEPINIGVLPESQTVTYVLRFIDQADNDKKLRQPRRDAFQALVRENAQATVTTEDNETFDLTIGAGPGSGEWTSENDYYDPSGRPFKQIGFFLTCDVFRA